VPDDGPRYRPRKPTTTPSEGSLAQRDAFIALARQSLQAVRASAEAWRNGLTAFLTLVTAGVIIKGRDTTAGLSVPWRIAITALIGGGLALAIIGLWRVLAAQAGSRYRLVTRDDIRRGYGTVEAYQVAMAERATADLHMGRRLVFAALSLLLLGVGVSWWAPPAPAGPPAFVKATFDSTEACGALRSADNGQLHLDVTGRRDPVIIPFNHLSNLAVVSACA